MDYIILTNGKLQELTGSLVRLKLFLRSTFAFLLFEIRVFYKYIVKVTFIKSEADHYD